jgi:metallo-beta-lactamase family protein
MKVKVTFLGASETVTGSKYLVEGSSAKILVDAGMFQGDKAWREKNWHNPPFSLEKLDAVCLTHAHLDHTGILPRYVKLGLKCPVFAHRATYSLSKLLLIDSAILQEEEAEYRAKNGSSRYSPPLPLYVKKDAEEALNLFREISYGEETEIAQGVKATWFNSGHLLGAGSLRLNIDDKTLIFSGDIGRDSDPIVNSPEKVDFGDLLLIESTYGDKEHGKEDVEEKLKEEIELITSNGGVLLIPSFAVGRTQRILYHLKRLKERSEIENLAIYIDSPMSRDATKVYLSYQSELNPNLIAEFKQGSNPVTPKNLFFVNSREDSKKLNSVKGSAIIISASGMLTGGRILHHLLHRLGGENNSILFVGHQPVGGKGYHLLNGGNTLRIFNQTYPVKCRVAMISGLSAHADKSELLNWCRFNRVIPNKVGIVHGELNTSRSFAQALQNEFNWNVSLPKYGESWFI